MRLSDEEIDRLAQTAYDAYGLVVNYKNYQGNPMPAFDDLGELIQDAWREATVAVVNATPAGDL